MHERQSTKDIKMTLKDAKKSSNALTKKLKAEISFLTYQVGKSWKVWQYVSVDEAMGKMVPSYIVGGNTN